MNLHFQYDVLFLPLLFSPTADTVKGDQKSGSITVVFWMNKL